MPKRKSINDDKMKAHLCPGLLRGRRICLVKVFKKNDWEVVRRLKTHCLEGVGNKSHGTSIAIKINGTPNEVGEANWLKRLVTIVRFRWILKFLMSLRKVH